MSFVGVVGSAVQLLPPLSLGLGTEVAPPAQATAPATRPREISPLPNPRLYVDLALNRVVLEFFNANGTLANSIPSQRQLAAYRLASLSGSA